MSTATPSPVTEHVPVPLDEHRSCVQCGYDLFGLPIGGACPECARPVADSLKGILLQYASPEYLGSVRSGLSLVLNGILLQVVLTVAGMGLGIAGLAQQWSLVMNGVGLGVTVLIYVGYLRLTTPDPQFTGTERPDSARQVVRTAVLLQLILALVQMLLVEAVKSSTAGPAAAPTSLVLLAVWAAALAAMVLWAVQFFAMMRYTRWLANRVPDAYAVERTKRYIWLLPVLTTVGIAAAGLGPLIALVMYWNLLDRMRKHFKAIERTGAPAPLKGTRPA